MKILIIDGYKKATFLIRQLLTQDHQITFLHEDPVFAEKILNLFEVDTYAGNASTPKVLTNLDSKKFDVVISLSNSDDKNFVVCTLAQKLLEVNRTITLVSNPNNQKTFKTLGIDVSVSASHLITNIIQKVAVFKDELNFISLEEYEVHPHEITMEKSFSVIDKQLKDVDIPSSVVVCCIIRAGRSIIPNGSTVFKKLDRVIIFTTIDDDAEIRSVFL